MVRLSERTLQGMRRAYDGTLDARALLYRLVKSNTATGRSSTYERVESSPGVDLEAVLVRVDPMVVDEEPKSSLVEKGNEAYASVPVSAPILDQGDQLRLVDDEDEEYETYEIKGAADARSGVTLDRKYKVVRTA